LVDIILLSRGFADDTAGGCLDILTIGFTASCGADGCAFGTEVCGFCSLLSLIICNNFVLFIFFDKDRFKLELDIIDDFLCLPISRTGRLNGRGGIYILIP